MVFNSIEFLIFFPVVVLLFFLTNKCKPLRLIMLLVASYYFYISWNADLLYLILFTTLVSYAAGLLLSRAKKKWLRRFLLFITLIACLGVLFFFKYFNFFSDTTVSILNLFGMEQEKFHLNLILPVGISFYTFQTLSYVIDVYRGSISAEKNIGYYALYVSFFPQLVAGPIERPENLLPQLSADHRPSWENLGGGMRKLLIGFFKKVVVADLIAAYVNSVFNDIVHATGLGVLIATLLFAVQIYCDFAGYTDIAIGCAEMMGIRLMQNFDRPYSAESIQEFWRRWHISLSSWFRDYIYFPLGGSRCSKFRNYCNLMIVFFVSGLWHGADWTFVLWGGLHGLYQVIGKILHTPREKIRTLLHIGEDAKLLHLIRRFGTFVLVAFAWIFFRANSINDLSALLGKLFTDWEFTAAYAQNTFDTMGITLSGALITVFSIFIMQRMDAVKLKLSRDYDGVMPVFQYAYLFWIIALAWILLFVGDGASTFIYFQF